MKIKIIKHILVSIQQQRVAGTTSAVLSRSSPDCRRKDIAMPVVLFPLGWDQSNPLRFNLCVQDFLVAGGLSDDNILSSVLTLPLGATAWTPLSSLPRGLDRAQASIVGGRLRVNGGFLSDDGFYRSEVMIEKWRWCTFPINADGCEIINQ